MEGAWIPMTRMDYSRNHSRSMSTGPRYYGDEPVFVTCLICRGPEPADGTSAVRARAERGVKTRMGYHGPAQVWLCRTCVDTYGTLVTKDLADELAPHRASALVPDPEPADEPESESNFWKWALAVGVAVVVGWACREG